MMMKNMSYRILDIRSESLEVPIKFGRRFGERNSGRKL